MSAFRSFVDRVLAGFLILLMFVSVINVLWQVFTRSILNDPSAWTEELARYLLIWIGLFGAAYAAGKGMHLAIDLLPNRLNPLGRHVLALTTDGVILAFAVAVMIVGGYRLVSLTLMMGQQSASLGLQLGWVYSAIPVSGALIAFYSIESILQRIHARGRSAEAVHPNRSANEID